MPNAEFAIKNIFEMPNYSNYFKIFHILNKNLAKTFNLLLSSLEWTKSHILFSSECQIMYFFSAALQILQRFHFSIKLNFTQHLIVSKSTFGIRNTFPIYSTSISFHRDELDALCRIYRKLVSNCQYAAKTLASSSSSATIAKPHAAVEVSCNLHLYIWKK